ncbi:peptidase family C50-domain-containing protein [Zychaea mexicana]|uniref:peptidase family C50-domain-containing protein n=1 Tax=Zychaea mexicana TaxID=64656 RepID=UPI0022FF2FF5|nr:peptidase family C50-domain-containing protein [Zychaea mexicana]KAI9484692.1 peptidase family C50-domain-containing protein [Zychaea mexicana]
MQPPSLFGGSNLPWLKGHLEYLSDAYDEEHDLDDSEFQKKFVDIIPPHWTVCSLTMDPITEELYVVRLQAEVTPTVVKLPLQRSGIRPNAEGESIDYTSAVEELKQIISDSDKTISNAKYHTEKSAVNEWWKKRMQLDLQLKRLLNTIEGDWFGGFKGLLCGNYHEDEEGLNKFQRKINQLMHNFVYDLPSTGGEKEKSQKTMDINLEMCRVFLRLGSDPSSRDIDDIIYFLLSCYTSHGIAVDTFRADLAQVKKSYCKSIETMEIVQDNHVILITDKHLHQLPWESLPILRPQSVSRIPCLSFLRDRIMRNLASMDDDADTWSEVTINCKKTCYILNPSGDLMHTQNEFEAAFKSMDGWQGLIQEKPLEHRWQSMLESRDLYLYFGHSAGQSIIRGQNIKKLKQCPVAILMGCSSGTLMDKGEYDPDGYIMNYLLGGSPAVVANLWDVTDKSIDQLTGKMLNTWGLLKQNANRSTVSLVEAVSSSRDACTLPYLIGAAPIVYGVPVYIKS